MPLTRTLVSSTTLGALGAASATADLAKSAVDGLVQVALRDVFGLLPNAGHYPTQFFSRGQRLAQLANFSLDHFNTRNKLIDFGGAATGHRGYLSQ